MDEPVEPPVPADCDLRGLTFMPLDVMRLRDSDLALYASGDEFKAAVLLWCASWHRIPAGSLPDDDRALCRFSGLEPKVWKKARDGALRGWVKCADGLLYHDVVAEKAREAWQERQKYRSKRDADRERLQAWRDRKQSGSNAGETQVETLPETPPETRSETRVETRKTGEGSGAKGILSDPDGSGASPPTSGPFQSESEPKADAWNLALKVLMERGMHNRASAAKIVGKWSKAFEHAHIADAARAAWQTGTLDPVAYIEAALKRISAEAGDPLKSPSEMRQRLWMQDYAARPREWREHERGPKPGEPGCRVSPEIQRELGVEPAAPQPVRGAA